MEIEAEIDGKALFKHVVKDVACSSSNMLIATGKRLLEKVLENGEVIVAKIKEEEKNSDSTFQKRVSKIENTTQINFVLSRLNSIQSHFIA